MFAAVCTAVKKVIFSYCFMGMQLMFNGTLVFRGRRVHQVGMQ